MILADEPTASLDPRASELIEDFALRLAHPDSPMRIGWIWVSHDPPQLRRMADRVLVLAEGSVLAMGTIDELVHSDWQDVRRALGVDR